LGFSSSFWSQSHKNRWRRALVHSSQFSTALGRDLTIFLPFYFQFLKTPPKKEEVNRNDSTIIADFRIGSDAVCGCRSLNRQRHSLAGNLWVGTGAVLIADFWIGSDAVFGCRSLNRQRPSWLLISELAAAQFGFRFMGRQWRSSRCRFLNRQQRSFWLSISESATVYFFAVDFWISSGKIFGRPSLNRQRLSFWLSISESAAT